MYPKAGTHRGSRSEEGFFWDHALSREPFADARNGISARRLIGADMRSPRAVGAVGEPGDNAHRIFRAIEFVISARVDDDGGLRAAAACSRHHLLAGRGRCPIIGTAHQNQSRNASTPGGSRKPPATWIERDRRAEIRNAVARDDAWPHCPERRDGATRPAQERDTVFDGPALPLHPAA